MKDQKSKLLVIAGAAVFVIGAFIVTSFVFGQRDQTASKSAVNAQAVNSSTPDNSNPITSAVSNALPQDTGPLTLAESILQVIGRLFIAVILSAALAFRPRKDVPLFRRSLFVSQTQILLAVVAAALMMVVGDNTARAFAIFAAASLVRFRTNIRDPKEITVLLISLAIGLTAGVGRWELGLSLCLFALALLWVLEYNEYAQVVRGMELTVKTKDTERTQEILKKIFRRMKIDAEVRELEPPDEKKGIGSIVYYMNLRLNLSTDYISDRILNADTHNIEGIQWSKSKGSTDIYQ